MIRVLSLLTFASLLTAQSARISGTVQDPTGGAIAGASVEVFGKARLTAETDSAGKFSVDNLPPGRYHVTIGKDGFSTSETDADAGANELKIQLDLAPVAAFVQTISKIPELTLHVPFLVTEVGAQELRRTNAASFDEALREVAGLQHATQGNVFTRVATRGLRDTADTMVLLDGVPFRQLNGAADLTMIPVSALQGVEFVKGAASSMYGRNAIGGVMQFLTVPEAAPQRGGNIAFTTASFGTYEGQGAFQQPTKHGRVAAAGNISRSDGYQDRTGRDSQFFTLSGDHVFSPLFALRLSALVSDVNAGRGSIIPLINGRPAYGITREVNYGIPGARLEGLLHSYTAKVDSQLNNRSTLTNAFNFNRYDRFSTGGITIIPAPTASNKGWSESDNRQDTWINDTVFRFDSGTSKLRNTFLGGSTFEWGNQDQASPTFTNPPTFVAPRFDTPTTNVNNDPKGIRGAVVTSYFDQAIQSLYAQDNVRYGRVGITAGFRWDHFDQKLVRDNAAGVTSQYAGSKISPRIGGDVALIDREKFQLVAFGNLTRGFRPQFPALSTLNNVTVPQLLRPEVTRNYEGGLRLRSGILSAQASYFDMRKIDGQRSFRTGPDTFLFANATTRVRGIETEVKARLPHGHSWFGNYAFQTAQNIDFRPSATTNFSGYRLRMTPRNIAGTGVTLVASRLSWTTSVAYVGSRPLRDNIVNPQFLPSYTVVNSSLSGEFGRFQAVLSASNLADRYYIADDFSSQDAGCPGVPRRVSLTLRWRF